MSQRFLRKIIRISALDSPNVQRGLAQARGEDVSDWPVVPGVLSYEEYQERLATWDEIMQCVGLRGEFYAGAEVLLYPPEWLNAAATRHNELVNSGLRRVVTHIGVDPGGGLADTVWTGIDEHGVIFQEWMKTPDATLTFNKTLLLMSKWGVKGENVVFDAGGGGKEIAAFLRERGHKVRTVGFGEAVTPQYKVSRRRHLEVRYEKEEAVVYKNRRAQMYYELREVLDPSRAELGVKLFAIPRELVELRKQLAPVPLLYDGERRVWLPPKQKKDPNSDEVTMTELIGRSPDHSDSLVLALFGMNHIPNTGKLGTW